MIEKVNKMLEDMEAEISVKLGEAYQAEEGKMVLAAQEAYNREMDKQREKIEVQVREQYNMARGYLYNLREELLKDVCQTSCTEPAEETIMSMTEQPREVDL